MPLFRLPLTTLTTPFITLALLISVVALFSSTNWPTTWCFFELNIILFVLLLTFDPSKTKTIATATYFLAQALGSSLLLLGALITIYHPSSIMYQYFIVPLMTLGILVKTASAPFQQWLVTIIPHINWISILLLSTLQKLAPLLLLTNILIITNNTLTLAYIFLILSLLIGAIGIMNSSHLKPLLAFSSLHHLGWILTGLTTTTTSRTHFYILLYLLTLTPLMLLLNTLNAALTSSAHTMPTPAPFNPRLITALLLALAGLPPFPLFFIKLTILTQTIIATPLLIIILLITTALSSLSYLRFALVFMLAPSTQSIILK